MDSNEPFKPNKWHIILLNYIFSNSTTKMINLPYKYFSWCVSLSLFLSFIFCISFDIFYVTIFRFILHEHIIQQKYSSQFGITVHLHYYSIRPLQQQDIFLRFKTFKSNNLYIKHLNAICGCESECLQATSIKRGKEQRIESSY